MINLPHKSGGTLPASVTTVCFALLLSAAGSNHALAPSWGYAKEKILCVANPGYPQVQFSKGRVGFRHSYSPQLPEPTTLKHGDIIYTGIDGFISLQISPGENFNAGPRSQLRVKFSSDCRSSPPTRDDSGMARLTPAERSLSSPG